MDVPEYPFFSRSQSICLGMIACTLIREFGMSVKLWHSRCILMILKEVCNVRLNEHGKIVVTNMQARFYRIGAFLMSINSDVSWRVQFQHPWIGEPLPSQIKRWSSSLTLQKDDLCSAYDAIKHIIWRPSYPLFSPGENQSYAPGSVLTSRGRNLVGRVPIRLGEWDVEWYGWDNDTTILLSPSTHKSVVTLLLSLLANFSLAVVQYQYLYHTLGLNPIWLRSICIHLMKCWIHALRKLPNYYLVSPLGVLLRMMS